MTAKEFIALETQVAAYLDALRGEFSEQAYHSLIEIGPGVLPSVAMSFRRESDARVRSVLVNIAWQTRSPLAVAFLREALKDEARDVWKEALDGLVTIGDQTALDAIRRARVRADEIRSPWLAEAEQQIVAHLLRDHPGQ